MARRDRRLKSKVVSALHRLRPETAGSGERNQSVRAGQTRPAGHRDVAERLCSAGMAVDREGELVLTRRGMCKLAARVDERPAATRPVWDAAERTLVWEGRVVKRLRREAAGQVAVLAAFEARGWPGRIDDPLPADEEFEPSQRLRDTVRNLNRSLVKGTIRFRTDGQGLGVCWEGVA